MEKKRKIKLADLFDSGEITSEEAKSAIDFEREPQDKSYWQKLVKIEEALKTQAEVNVPANFTNTVLSHLPQTISVKFRPFSLRDILIPILVFLTLIISFMFADFTGITASLNNLATWGSSTNNSNIEIVFVLTTAAGILVGCWLIITSFFGIRSRRYSRHS